MKTRDAKSVDRPAEERERRLDVERARQRRVDRLLDDVDELGRDFHDAPEQVGSHLEELRRRGAMDAGFLERALAHLARQHGEAFSWRVRGRLLGATSSAAQVLDPASLLASVERASTGRDLVRDLLRDAARIGLAARGDAERVDAFLDGRAPVRRIGSATLAPLGDVVGPLPASVGLSEDLPTFMSRAGVRAAAVGDVVVAQPGAIRPDAGVGLDLLAHELVHVRQHAQGVGAVHFDKGTTPAEGEARKVAQATKNKRPPGKLEDEYAATIDAIIKSLKGITKDSDVHDVLRTLAPIPANTIKQLWQSPKLGREWLDDLVSNVEFEHFERWPWPLVATYATLPDKDRAAQVAKLSARDFAADRGMVTVYVALHRGLPPAIIEERAKALAEGKRAPEAALAYYLVKALPAARRSKLLEKKPDWFKAMEENLPPSVRQSEDFGYYEGSKEDRYRLLEPLLDKAIWKQPGRLRMALLMAHQAGLMSKAYDIFLSLKLELEDLPEFAKNPTAQYQSGAKENRSAGRATVSVVSGAEGHPVWQGLLMAVGIRDTAAARGVSAADFVGAADPSGAVRLAAPAPRKGKKQREDNKDEQDSGEIDFQIDAKRGRVSVRADEIKVLSVNVPVGAAMLRTKHGSIKGLRLTAKYATPADQDVYLRAALAHLQLNDLLVVGQRWMYGAGSFDLTGLTLSADRARVDRKEYGSRLSAINAVVKVLTKQLPNFLGQVLAGGALPGAATWPKDLADTFASRTTNYGVSVAGAALKNVVGSRGGRVGSVKLEGLEIDVVQDYALAAERATASLQSLDEERLRIAADRKRLAARSTDAAEKAAEEKLLEKLEAHCKSRRVHLEKILARCREAIDLRQKKKAGKPLSKKEEARLKALEQPQLIGSFGKGIRLQNAKLGGIEADELVLQGAGLDRTRTAPAAGKAKGKSAQGGVGVELTADKLTAKGLRVRGTKRRDEVLGEKRKELKDLEKKGTLTNKQRATLASIESELAALKPATERLAALRAKGLHRLTQKERDEYRGILAVLQQPPSVAVDKVEIDGARIGTDPGSEGGSATLKGKKVTLSGIALTSRYAWVKERLAALAAQEARKSGDATTKTQIELLEKEKAAHERKRDELREVVPIQEQIVRKVEGRYGKGKHPEWKEPLARELEELSRLRQQLAAYGDGATVDRLTVEGASVRLSGVGDVLKGGAGLPKAGLSVGSADAGKPMARKVVAEGVRSGGKHVDRVEGKDLGGQVRWKDENTLETTALSLGELQVRPLSLRLGGTKILTLKKPCTLEGIKVSATIDLRSAEDRKAEAVRSEKPATPSMWIKDLLVVSADILDATYTDKATGHEIKVEKGVLSNLQAKNFNLDTFRGTLSLGRSSVTGIQAQIGAALKVTGSANVGSLSVALGDGKFSATVDGLSTPQLQAIYRRSKGVVVVRLDGSKGLGGTYAKDGDKHSVKRLHWKALQLPSLRIKHGKIEVTAKGAALTDIRADATLDASKGGQRLRIKSLEIGKVAADTLWFKDGHIRLDLAGFSLAAVQLSGLDWNLEDGLAGLSGGALRTGKLESAVGVQDAGFQAGGIVKAQGLALQLTRGGKVEGGIHGLKIWWSVDAKDKGGKGKASGELHAAERKDRTDKPSLRFGYDLKTHELTTTAHITKLQVSEFSFSKGKDLSVAIPTGGQAVLSGFYVRLSAKLLPKAKQAKGKPPFEFISVDYLDVPSIAVKGLDVRFVLGGTPLHVTLPASQVASLKGLRVGPPAFRIWKDGDAWLAKGSASTGPLSLTDVAASTQAHRRIFSANVVVPKLSLEAFGKEGGKKGEWLRLDARDIDVTQIRTRLTALGFTVETGSKLGVRGASLTVHKGGAVKAAVDRVELPRVRVRNAAKGLDVVIERSWISGSDKSSALEVEALKKKTTVRLGELNILGARFVIDDISALASGDSRRGGGKPLDLRFLDRLSGKAAVFVRAILDHSWWDPSQDPAINRDPTIPAFKSPWLPVVARVQAGQKIHLPKAKLPLASVLGSYGIDYRLLAGGLTLIVVAKDLEVPVLRWPLRPEEREDAAKGLLSLSTLVKGARVKPPTPAAKQDEKSEKGVADALEFQAKLSATLNMDGAVTEKDGTAPSARLVLPGIGTILVGAGALTQFRAAGGTESGLAMSIGGVHNVSLENFKFGKNVGLNVGLIDVWSLKNCTLGFHEGKKWMGLAPERLAGTIESAQARNIEVTVQKKGRDVGGADRVRDAAVAGTRGSGARLPHAERIQAAFGSHDVSGVRAHVGGDAAAACADMGAEAYASGRDVAFRAQPGLHTAAHEAAHVVQQRAGVSLKGGVGQAGDAYERQADAVADAVVAGRSVEALLGGGAGAGSQPASVQRKDTPEGDRTATKSTAGNAGGTGGGGSKKAATPSLSAQLGAEFKALADFLAPAAEKNLAGHAAMLRTLILKARLPSALKDIQRSEEKLRSPGLTDERRAEIRKEIENLANVYRNMLKMDVLVAQEAIRKENEPGLVESLKKRLPSFLQSVLKVYDRVSVAPTRTTQVEGSDETEMKGAKVTITEGPGKATRQTAPEVVQPPASLPKEVFAVIKRIRKDLLTDWLVKRRDEFDLGDAPPGQDPGRHDSNGWNYIGTVDARKVARQVADGILAASGGRSTTATVRLLFPVNVLSTSDRETLRARLETLANRVAGAMSNGKSSVHAVRFTFTRSKWSTKVPVSSSGGGTTGAESGDVVQK